MKIFFYIIFLNLVFISCNEKSTNLISICKQPLLTNLDNNDTLFIHACISHNCGGEWGCCLELSKFYRQYNGFGVTFVSGIIIWNGDTIIDSSKIKKIKKTLTKKDIKQVDEFLYQVDIFSDTLSLTSNGPNYYVIKTKNYLKEIVQDHNQWIHYQRLKDSLFK